MSPRSFWNQCSFKSSMLGAQAMHSGYRAFALHTLTYPGSSPAFHMVFRACKEWFLHSEIGVIPEHCWVGSIKTENKILYVQTNLYVTFKLGYILKLTSLYFICIFDHIKSAIFFSDFLRGNFIGCVYEISPVSIIRFLTV